MKWPEDNEKEYQEILEMTEEEHKAYITPSAKEVARAKRYRLRETLRVG